MRPLEHDAEDATGEASDRLPPLEGWERCAGVDRSMVERDLQAHLHPDELGHVGSIQYVDRPNPSEDGQGMILGTTRFDRTDPLTGRARLPEIAVYDHGDGSDPEEVRETVMHEVGHTVWDRADPDLRTLYAQEVYAWGKAHPDVAQADFTLFDSTVAWAPPVSDYAATSPEEHFCEHFAKATLKPDELAALDRFAPSSRSRAAWVEQIRRSARGEPLYDA